MGKLSLVRTLLPVLAWYAVEGLAATVDLHGLVLDAGSAGVSGVSVTLAGSQLTTITDGSGGYQLSGAVTATLPVRRLLTLQETHSFQVNGCRVTSLGVRPVAGVYLQRNSTAISTGAQGRGLFAMSALSSVVDTLVFHKTGYKTTRIPIEAYVGTYDATMAVGTDPTWSMLALPETGQDTSFTSVFGEDCDYSIHPISYGKNADGTVTDQVTGLTWQGSESGDLSFGNAKSYCDSLSLAGSSDWRLPDAHEAYSIQNLGRANPSIDTTVFGHSTAEYWWTSTRGLEVPGRIWVTNAGGGLGAHDTLESVTNGGVKHMHARCVRTDFQGASTHVFSVVSDSVVLDGNTGLEWSRYSVATLGWDSALACSEALTLGGFSDWRLPNVKELQSINDEGRVFPSLDTVFFPDANVKVQAGARPTREYWTSTTLINHPEKVWYVDFNSGLISYAERATAVLYVRVVRGGQ